MKAAGTEEQWSELESLWKEQPVRSEVPNEILSWVRRQERRMRLVLASEWLMWVAIGFFLVKVILDQSLPDAPARLFFAFSMFALGLGFSIVNRRGLWAPLEETAQAYVNLALLRLRRKRREVHFSWLFLLIQLVIINIWHFGSTSLGLEIPVIRNPESFLIFCAGMIAFLSVYSTYIYWRTGREKSSLKELQKKYLN
ncbi:DUF1673 family protein [Microbulbifer sp. GL-2]|uniref:DUF1673 family protein n=1 Tax=Microbulbifer sp. GL-2 TaxID=2591606 RepID=UPI001162D2C3|nr:DUF1673 family protein [Microbulbifer sp. GL-2]BBM01513.1 hypothetical protein GL2_15870 [Microbulbifer sp. GL-2]